MIDRFRVVKKNTTCSGALRKKRRESMIKGIGSFLEHKMINLKKKN